PFGDCRMRVMWDLISVFSCAVSESAWRSSWSFTESRISRVVFTPRSAESRALSRCLRAAGSICFSPRKMLSTVSERAVLVFETEVFSRSRSVRSGLPKREIISRSVADGEGRLSGSKSRFIEQNYSMEDPKWLLGDDSCPEAAGSDLDFDGGKAELPGNDGG